MYLEYVLDNGIEPEDNLQVGETTRNPGYSVSNDSISKPKLTDSLSTVDE